jgi:hypothetical protein
MVFTLHCLEKCSGATTFPKGGCDSALQSGLATNIEEYNVIKITICSPG